MAGLCPSPADKCKFDSKKARPGVIYLTRGGTQTTGARETAPADLPAPEPSHHAQGPRPPALRPAVFFRRRRPDPFSTRPIRTVIGFAAGDPLGQPEIRNRMISQEADPVFPGHGGAEVRRQGGLT